MNGDHELIRIVDRARIELVYTRASLHNYLHAEEPLSSEIGALISRCNDAVKEADTLIGKVRDRITPRPSLVKGKKL